MEYMTTQEAADLWGIKIRRVQSMCDSGIIPAQRIGNRVWVIPKGTPKPPDGRTKQARIAKKYQPLGGKIWNSSR